MRKCFAVVAAAAMVPLAANANPYASNVVISGTSVSFILNESADSLTYSLNGGAPVSLDGSGKGLKTFTLDSPTDTFSIHAARTDAIGYTIPTGNTVASSANGLSVTTNTNGFRLISDDANTLNKYNSPRGVAVSNNPNAPNFGTTYVTNSLAGAVGGRTLTGKGLYAQRADQSDAFGYGNAAQGNATRLSATQRHLVRPGDGAGLRDRHASWRRERMAHV